MNLATFSFKILNGNWCTKLVAFRLWRIRDGNLREAEKNLNFDLGAQHYWSRWERFQKFGLLGQITLIPPTESSRDRILLDPLLFWKCGLFVFFQLRVCLCLASTLSGMKRYYARGWVGSSMSMLRGSNLLVVFWYIGLSTMLVPPDWRVSVIPQLHSGTLLPPIPFHSLFLPFPVGPIFPSLTINRVRECV